MTSRSTASPSNPARRATSWLVAAVALLGLLVGPRVAEAGRKRLVVLPFSGPKAAAFQADVEKLLKKSHSVIPLKKWRDTADDLNATKTNERDIKKVARKLSVDGVVTGKVEKRGSRYLIHLALRDGATGKTVATPDLVERGTKLGTDSRDAIKQELMPAIADLSAGDDDEEAEDEEAEEAPARGKTATGKGKAGKSKPVDDEDDEEADDDDRPRMGKATKGKATKGKPVDEEEDEEIDDDEADAPRFGKGKAAKGKAAKGKPAPDDDSGDDSTDGDERVAAADDDTEGRADAEIEDEVETGPAGDPRRRPLDLAVGMSFTGRRLTFATNLTSNEPQGYKGSPVPGIYVGLEAFPLGFNRKNRSFTSNLGIQLVFDRVIKIASSIEKMGVKYDLPTTEQHLAAGLVYRQLIGAKLELDVSMRFNKRTFRIDRANPALEAGDLDIPNTNYSYIDPGLAVGYTLGPKLVLGAGARFLFVTSTGEMSAVTQYGGSTVIGVAVEAGVDYQLASKVLLRVAGTLTTLGFTFKGDGELTRNRDMDPADQDVAGARDTYWGGLATGVYLF